MQFLYPALTIGFLAVLAPPLIHLINMMRHRRVRWAAMDFLLQSHKKHRKWVWLKQLLLLLMRMAVMVLVVAMLAQLVTQRRYEGFFGTTLTHHYVLVDDSYSMTDRVGGTTAFERALKFVRRLGAEAASQELHQRFTVLRLSKALTVSKQPGDISALPQVADMNAVDVDSKFSRRLEEVVRRMEPTQLAVGPEPALKLLRVLMQQQTGENRVLYVVSDFRTNQWKQPREIRQQLADLDKSHVALHLVDCVRQQRTNLGLTMLQPSTETRAAGVPLFVDFAVKNFGPDVQENVQLQVSTIFHDPSKIADGSLNQPQGVIDELPVVQIDQIAPGQTVAKRVQVYFSEPGRHIVVVQLPEDPVAADNRRWCVVDLPETEPVLVVDGDPNQRNAFYLQSIFEPSQRVQTGIRPAVVDSAGLRDAAVGSLRRYRVIYLFDVDRLDDRALENLETYVKEGGGLAIFVGPEVNLTFYNQRLYRDGQGLLPMPLEHDDLLAIDPLNDAPDVEVVEIRHPVFRELVQGQNPLVRTMHVERFLRVPRGWTPGQDSGVQVLAKLRNGMPLAIEKQFGRGRVIAMTTTFAPYWNDMSLGPCVLIALRLQAYLGAPRRVTEDHLVGHAIPLQFDSTLYQQNVRIFAPSEDPAVPLVIERLAEKPSTDAKVYSTMIRPDETLRAGVHEVWMRALEGTVRATRYAVNVEPSEGDLTMVDSRQLLAAFDPVPVEVRYADQFETGTIDRAGFNQSTLIMALLILLLLVEQVMAYIASFHPTRRVHEGANR